MYGSSDQIALLTKMNKGDVSNAISGPAPQPPSSARSAPARSIRSSARCSTTSTRTRSCAWPGSRPLKSGGEFIEKLRADTATWLAHANRRYPLQPDLIPPEPRLLDMALAEISRASVLAEDPSAKRRVKTRAREGR